ncbi:hypothetical protein [Actinomadura sp. 3N407]|uniref:hypothetical protein n=1 Tax=Actinomadura sp. 3N407 TaxID=3457423 RepID=UPI003FCD1B45
MTHTPMRPESARTGASGSRRSDLGEFARGGAIGLLGSLTSAVSGFVLAIVVARVLGPAGAGVFFVVVAVFTMVTEVTMLGADSGLVRSGARLRALGRTDGLRRVLYGAHLPVLAASLVAAAGVLALTPWIAGTFVDAEHRDTAELMLWIAAPLLVVSALGRVALGGTRGLGGVAAFSVIQNIALPVSRPLLILLTFTLGLGLAGAMLAWSLPVLGVAMAGLWVLGRRVRGLESGGAEPPAKDPVAKDPVAKIPAAGGSAGTREDPASVRRFWAFSGPRGLAATLETAMVHANVPLVAALLTSADAGVYSTATRFVVSGTLALQAARLVIAPQIAAALARDEPRDAEALYSVATGWVLAVSAPIFLVLATYGSFVLGLFGEEFTRGGRVLAVLAGAMLVVLMFGNVQAVLLMGGKSSWALVNKSAALVAGTVAVFVLVPRYGLIGAAVAWALARLVDTSLGAVQVRYRLGLRLALGPACALAGWALLWFGGAGIAARWALGDGRAGFVVYCLVAVAGYGLALWWRRENLLQVSALRAALRERGKR